MNRFWFLIFFFFLGLGSLFQLQAQSYYGLPDSGATWKVGLFSWPGDLTLYIAQVVGDTVIDGKNYRKIYAHYKWARSVADTRDTVFNPAIAKFCAAIREENRKWYIRSYVWDNSGSGKEKLIYDFNLSVGDTVGAKDTISTQRPYLYKVIAKDSVLVGDNYRLRLRLSEREDWIDEMGSSIGLIFSGTKMHFHFISQLVCFYRSGEFLYRSASFPACDSIPVSREEEQSARPILLAPNPFSERAIVRLPPEIAFQQGLLYIYDSKGALAQTLSFGSPTFEVTRGNLSPGLYHFVYVLDNGKHFLGQKVVIE